MSIRRPVKEDSCEETVSRHMLEKKSKDALRTLCSSDILACQDNDFGTMPIASVQLGS